MTGQKRWNRTARANVVRPCSGDLPKTRSTSRPRGRLQSLESAMERVHQPLRLERTSSSQTGASPHALLPLTLCFSRETLTVVDNLGLTDEQRGDAARIVEAIQQYVEGQKISRAFNFSTAAGRNLRRLSRSSTSARKDMQILLRRMHPEEHQIIEGLIDVDTVEVLRERDLTLETTITKCRGQEAAKHQRAEITSRNMEAITVSNAHGQPTKQQHNPASAQAVGQTFIRGAKGNAQPMKTNWPLRKGL